MDDDKLADLLSLAKLALWIISTPPSTHCEVKKTKVNKKIMI
jgi:hypothetical protein